MKEWNKALDALLQEKETMAAASRCIYIVNAGRMNHGKSSLLNSLLGREAFRVADVRETRENAKAEYRKDVFVVDTPGLDADEMDDKEAFEVYKRANVILFVHNPRVGELHRSEIDHIGRIAAVVGAEYFWQHFAFVLTFQEEFGMEKLEEIREKIKMSLKDAFGVEGMPLFIVSNARYARGVQEQDAKKKEIFWQKSGILELRLFIEEKLPVWQGENLALQKQRFETLKEGAVRYLNGEREKLEKHRDELQEGYRKRASFAEAAIQKARRSLGEYIGQIAEEMGCVSRLEVELLDLTREHERGLAQY